MIAVTVEAVTPGMMIIPEGRTRPVEVLSIELSTRSAHYLVGHMGTGFNVSAIPAGSLVKVAA